MPPQFLFPGFIPQHLADSPDSLWMEWKRFLCRLFPCCRRKPRNPPPRRNPGVRIPHILDLD